MSAPRRNPPDGYTVAKSGSLPSMQAWRCTGPNGWRSIPWNRRRDAVAACWADHDKTANRKDPTMGDDILTAETVTSFRELLADRLTRANSTDVTSRGGPVYPSPDYLLGLQFAARLIADPDLDL